MSEPLVLSITAEDLASAVLGKVAQEVQRLAPAAQTAATGTGVLTSATSKLTGEEAKAATTTTQLTGAVQKMGTDASSTAPKIVDLSTSTGKAHSSFLSGAKSGLAFAGALTGMQLGLGLVGNVLQATVGHVVGFESALANVNTLGNNSVAVQAKLREELLKLPSALGDSVTLAKGLYDVLSAGVAPAEAVAFLATSASLAKAGLADLGTTTEALTKTMAAFKIPTELAAQVADVLFKTVDLGQGNLQAFAHAMPQVTQSSAALGLSLVDTTAFMATLTQTFGNADKAATGFRSMLTQAIQNSDKFAAAGVNITRVLGEQGLAGFLRVLQDLTGGNSEKLKALIGDTEGYDAALAGSGPQFQLFLQNLEKTKTGLGVVQAGLKTQSATAAESWKAFTAEAGKAADQLAPPFLAAFAQLARGMQLSMASARTEIRETQTWFAQLGASFEAAGKADSLVGFLKAISSGFDAATVAQTKMTFAVGVHSATNAVATKGIQAAANAAMDEAGAMDSLSASLLESTKRLTESGQASQQLTNDLAGLALTAANFKPGALKIIDPEDAKRSADAAIAQYGRIEASGKVSFSAILASAKAMLEGISDQMGASSPVTLAFKAMVDGMEQRAREGTGKIAALFQAMGLKSKEQLQTDAQETAQNLGALLDTVQQKSVAALDITRDGAGRIQKVLQAGSVSGIEVVRDASGKIIAATNAAFAEGGKAIVATTTATTAQQVALWHKLVEDINKGELPRLTDAMQETLNRMAPIVKKATGEVVRIFTDDFGHVRAEITKTTDATAGLGNILEALTLRTEAAAANFRKLSGEADGAEGSVAGLSATAIMLGHTLNAAGIEVNAYGNAIAELSKETQILNGLQINVFEQFASDVPGLLEQLARVRKEIGAIGGGAGAGSPEAQFQLKGLREELALIQEKLAALGVDQFGHALAAAATTATSALAQTTAQVDTLASSTARLTTETVAAAGAVAALAGSYGTFAGGYDPAPGGRLPGGFDFAPGGRRDLPGGGAARPLPLPTGGGGTVRPPGFNVPGRPLQRFAGGGIVGGSGGTDSQLILATPGERVSTPQQQQGDRAISVSFGDITINVQGGAAGGNPVELGRIAAQAFVTHMAPALNESLRRGGGEKFK